MQMHPFPLNGVATTDKQGAPELSGSPDWTMQPQKKIRVTEPYFAYYSRDGKGNPGNELGREWGTFLLVRVFFTDFYILT